jgi:RNA polymerase sigma factor (sigma-70 family)
MSVARRRRNGENRKEAVRKAGALFAAYGSFIRAVIHFRAKNQFREDDFYQAFFLSLVRKPVPADVRNVKGFLYRAITHDIIDFTRRQDKHQHCLAEYAQEIRISINKSTPEDAIVLRDEREPAFRCLTRQLRQREAEAVVLRYRDGYSIAEIASEMGVDKRTVSRYLSAGLRQLRRDLAVE